MTDLRLLSDADLERSDVVANNAMNRERGLSGVNSYQRCLGFDPVAMITEVDPGGGAAWLDLCCGSGRALIEAAASAPDSVTITGVDLVDYFKDAAGPRPELIAASIASWRPSRQYDLITCVHGLHYIGDKLDLLARVAAWLTPGGRFVADFDVASVRIRNHSPSVATMLRRAGFGYDARRKLVRRDGGGEVGFAYRYLGADDHAGPNYTGQAAVVSYYEPV